MPLSREILNQHVTPTFVETGTYQGEGVQMALDAGFKAVITVEYDKCMAQDARAKFLKDNRVTCLHGDSADHLARIVSTLTTPTTFWLDAHPLITPMPLFSPEFPLLRELFAIKRALTGAGHIILIDDLRTFSEYERSVLVHAMHQLWPDATHTYYSDRIATDDVYCCVLPPRA